MGESRDEPAGRGWAFGIVVALLLFAGYVLILGPLEWMLYYYRWTNSLVAHMVPIIYYPLILLADMTGTLDWLNAYVDWWKELG
jgi:hypothetical protein